MGTETKIQWTDHTFNPWWGCVKVSPGCQHCYAETFSKRTGHDVWGPAKTTGRRKLSEANWRKPEKWNEAARGKGERARVFCASMADVFEDHPDVVEERARLFGLIESTPWLDWQLLTKRPENVMEMTPWLWSDGFPVNVWIGTSVEDQQRADERIPHLLRIPARVRFLSCEPLLGPVDLRPWLHLQGAPLAVGARELPDAFEPLNWIIIGGESGPGARPMDVDWARDLVEQAQSCGVAPFVKQLGARPVHLRPLRGPRNLTPPAYDAGREPIHLRDSKGGDWDEWPDDLRVREMPA